MRAIRFRGQDEDGNWLYGDLRQRMGYWPAIIESYCTDEGKVGYREIAVKEGTVGQFTGLTDKNGKKIFEGDIVEVTSLRCGYEDFMKKMLCEIVYDNDLCCFNFLTSDRKRCMCTTIPDAEIEVIGNIYDKSRPVAQTTTV